MLFLLLLLFFLKSTSYFLTGLLVASVAMDYFHRGEFRNLNGTCRRKTGAGGHTKVRTYARTCVGACVRACERALMFRAPVCVDALCVCVGCACARVNDVRLVCARVCARV